MFAIRFVRAALTVAMLLAAPAGLNAQELQIGTVTREPFSMAPGGTDTGFSIELWQELARELGLNYSFRRFETFSGMLDAVENNQVDAAIANISITARREQIMDFSHPIFASGLQIMVPSSPSTHLTAFRALFSADMLIAILLAFLTLWAAGMVMWFFERRRQPYFDLPAHRASFPAFWWALNLVVNGGFEERAPKSWPGRLFGVLLVISSLFVVSVFVARVSSALTIEAIQGNVASLADLRGRRVGSITSSTAAIFLNERNLTHVDFPSPTEMFAAFEEGSIDAAVFDAPILAYYLTDPGHTGRLAGAVLNSENYGIALPTDSPLTEDINRALLSLRETGIYDEIYRRWFGARQGDL